MFIGHYGVSLAAKRAAPRLSLGLLFLAVQFLDVVFSVLVLAGVEKLRIVPGFTQYNPYDLYWMPYSHSLLGGAVWSLLCGAAGFAILRRLPAHERVMAAAVLGAAVFSHFVLDALVHTPDLPLGLSAGSTKIGLGLWNHRALAVAAELASLCAGGLLYLRWSQPRTKAARMATGGFGLALVALTVSTPFLPDPASGAAFALQALAGYLALAGAAWWVDRGRDPRAPAAEW